VTDTEHRTTLAELGYREQWSPFGDPDAQDPDPAVRNRFFGKYQGTVVNNEDPYQQGRLIVNVPDVHGLLPSTWALPCVPLTDIGMGTFMRPRIGANVWVEFEQGDPQRPIWVGCFWGKGETPPLAKAANAIPPTNAVMTIETASSGLSVSDLPVPAAPLPGTVVIRAGGFTATISLTPTGVTITAPTVNIVATTRFSVTSPNFAVA
jgi:Type VI secretion system/phage-baseplate injector OB domain